MSQQETGDRAPLFTKLNIDQEKLQKQVGQANTFRQKTLKNSNYHVLSQAQSSQQVYKENFQMPTNYNYDSLENTFQDGQQQIQNSLNRQQRPQIPRLNLQQKSFNLNEAIQQNSYPNSYQGIQGVQNSATQQNCKYFSHNRQDVEELFTQKQPNQHSQDKQELQGCVQSGAQIIGSDSLDPSIQLVQSINIEQQTQSNSTPQVQVSRKDQSCICKKSAQDLNSGTQADNAQSKVSFPDNTQLQVTVTQGNSLHNTAYSSRSYRSQQQAKSQRQYTQSNSNPYRMYSARSSGQEQVQYSPRIFTFQQSNTKPQEDQRDWHFTMDQVTGRSSGLSPRQTNLQEGTNEVLSNVQVQLDQRKILQSKSLSGHQYINSSRQPRAQSQLHTTQEESPNFSQAHTISSTQSLDDKNSFLNIGQKKAEVAENKDIAKLFDLQFKLGKYDQNKEISLQSNQEDALVTQLIQSNNQLIKERGQLQLNIQQNLVEKRTLTERLEYLEKVKHEESQQKEQEIQVLKEQLLIFRANSSIGSISPRQGTQFQYNKQLQQHLQQSAINVPFVQHLQQQQSKQEQAYNVQINNFLQQNTVEQHIQNLSKLCSQNYQFNQKDIKVLPKPQSLSLYPKEPPGFGVVQVDSQQDGLVPNICQSDLSFISKQQDLQVQLQQQKQQQKRLQQRQHSQQYQAQQIHLQQQQQQQQQQQKHELQQQQHQENITTNSLFKYQSLPAHKKSNTFCPQLARQIQTDSSIGKVQALSDENLQSQQSLLHSSSTEQFQYSNIQNLSEAQNQFYQQKQEYAQQSQQQQNLNELSNLQDFKQNLNNQYLQAFPGNQQLTDSSSSNQQNNQQLGPSFGSTNQVFNIYSQSPYYGFSIIDNNNTIKPDIQQKIQQDVNDDVCKNNQSEQQNNNLYQNLNYSQLNSISEILG